MMGCYTYNYRILTPTFTKDDNDLYEGDKLGTLEMVEGMICKDDQHEYHISFTGIDYNALFSISGSHILETYSPDALICDEAHRLLTYRLQPLTRYKMYDYYADKKKTEIVEVDSAMIDSYYDDNQFELLSLLISLIIKIFSIKTEVIFKAAIESNFFKAFIHKPSYIKAYCDFIEKLMNTIKLSDHETEIKAAFKLDQVSKEKLYFYKLSLLENKFINRTDKEKMQIEYAIMEFFKAYSFIKKTYTEPFDFDDISLPPSLVYEKGVDFYTNFIDTNINNLIETITHKGNLLMFNNGIGGNAITDDRFRAFIAKMKQSILLTGTPIQVTNNDMIDIIWFLNNDTINKSNNYAFSEDVKEYGGNALFKPFDNPEIWKTTRDFSTFLNHWDLVLLEG